MLSITPKSGWVVSPEPQRVSAPIVERPALQSQRPIYIIAAPPVKKRSLLGRIVRFCLLAQLGILALFMLPLFGPIVLLVAFVGLIVIALTKYVFSS